MYLHIRASNLLFKHNITLVAVLYGGISHIDYLSHSRADIQP